MTYEFDHIWNRRDTGSMKWDIAADELPLWVADMDFQTAPEVMEAVEKRAALGIYGYQIVTEEWYEAYQKWWKNHHDFQIEKDWLIFCTGVVPAISCAVKRMTNTGDNVVIQTPVYDIFFHSVENHGRHVLENKLQYNGKEYVVDYEDLEEKLAHPNTTMMILCNPHNPIGKIWSKEELERIGALCKKHHVLVLSDEIHCDLTYPGFSYVPFASVAEDCAANSITCIAASKAFNLAGLQSAAVVIPEEGIREKMNRGLNSDEIAEPGTFAVDATVAALTKGEEWLLQLRQYINDNIAYAKAYIKKEIPSLQVLDSQATYLLWIYCGEVSEDSSALASSIRSTTGLFLSEGKQYRGDGKHFLRMNTACPRTILEEGLRRLKRGIENSR